MKQLDSILGKLANLIQLGQFVELETDGIEIAGDGCRRLCGCGLENCPAAIAKKDFFLLNTVKQPTVL